MTSTVNLLDTIETTERQYHGIVDFATSKHIILYDLTNESSTELTMLVLLWRLYYPHKRFSFFHAEYFKSLKLPTPILINKKIIKNRYSSVQSNKPRKRVMSKISTT